jgi:ABC-2 type transport system ATP-binding protein
MTDGHPAVDFRDVRVTLGRQEILHGVTAGLRAGSLTGLIGPSGSGKTTLMRVLVGVQQTGSGTADVLGSPAGSSDLRARIGYVSQAPSVYEDLTVGQNLAYFAAVLRPDDADRRSQMCARALLAVDMADLTQRRVGTLSGGERSRVSLAVALLDEPDLLVLDEPTVGLDPVLRLDLWRTFAELAAAGVTLLVSSHVMDEAERCDDLLLMREGTLLFHGATAALLAQTGCTSVENAFLHLIGERRRPGDPADGETL